MINRQQLLSDLRSVLRSWKLVSLNEFDAVPEVSGCAKYIERQRMRCGRLTSLMAQGLMQAFSGVIYRHNERSGFSREQWNCPRNGVIPKVSLDLSLGKVSNSL